MRFLLLPILCSTLLAAAEPLFETQRLFALTPNNKPNYRIPGIIQAPNGDILVICEKRNDGIGYIYERADKGSTHYWDELHFARFNIEWLQQPRS